MSIPSTMEGTGFDGGSLNEAIVTDNGEQVTLVSDRYTYAPQGLIFQNDEVGVNMNQNAAFGGTPDKVHNGIDSVLWTGSSIIGGKFTISNGDHASEGVAAIVDYSAFDGGETVTITLNGSTTVLTEGVDFTAATSNAATATSLATALSGVTNVSSATASAASVTVLASDGADLETLTTNAAADEMTATALAVKIDNANVGDILEFDKGSDLTVANYTAISLRIYVDKDWKAGDSICLYAWDTALAQKVGVAQSLEDYFNFGSFDEWQALAIPFENLEVSGTFDAIRIEVLTAEGKSPKFYIDELQVEETGTPLIFTATPFVGTQFEAMSLQVEIVDTLDTTLANATVPNLTWNKLMSLTQLSNGIVLRSIREGITQFAVTMNHYADFRFTGFRKESLDADSTTAILSMLIVFSAPIILHFEDGDRVQFIIQDDLSSLISFRGLLRGRVREL